VDKWGKFYGTDATFEEKESLSKIISRIDRTKRAERYMELYQEAVCILHTIFTRQVAKKHSVISSKLKFVADPIDPDIEVDGEPTFGYTEVVINNFTPHK